MSWNDSLHPLHRNHITPQMIISILIWYKLPVYCTSIYIPMSFPKGNYHHLINHRYPLILWSSHRPYPRRRPWNNWLNIDKANIKHFTRHQAPHLVCRQPSQYHHMISCQWYGATYVQWWLVLNRINDQVQSRWILLLVEKSSYLSSHTPHINDEVHDYFTIIKNILAYIVEA